jgi:hypothetical protein
MKKLFLTSIAALFLTTGIAHAIDPATRFPSTRDKEPDMIFGCPDSSGRTVFVFVGHNSITLEGIATSDFRYDVKAQFNWDNGKATVTLDGEKCELVYPPDLG